MGLRSKRATYNFKKLAVSWCTRIGRYHPVEWRILPPEPLKPESHDHSEELLFEADSVPVKLDTIVILVAVPPKPKHRPLEDPMLYLWIPSPPASRLGYVPVDTVLSLLTSAYSCCPCPYQ